ncbi:Pyridoxamine 5'-phosphate oxidase [Penicillium malachiteum]|uniref:Pyridoxamine 5'-phosphate oxidase n=1 Tax=Penicillium malachiteum TaxID=1324776 RepID=UPI002547B2E3|nr:Pyridoxamine 5'-phosphate oxidase [Penicillium malachiteum]KAJ5713037.1 Pyridoxamine 5'-phosphate oxidase [Penicillium malachiteum]
MSQNEVPDANRRPKKLIFAPGDIATTPNLDASNPLTRSKTPEQTSVPFLNPVEALRSDTSTPNSTTENEILSNPARAHQFGTNPPLTVSQIHGTNPLHQFHTWFKDPRLAPSSAPETCTLATAELPSGRVSARTVYLKELDERGWVVYSNWGSREGKGAQVFGCNEKDILELGSMPEPAEAAASHLGNRWGALTFSWASVERQVRVEGIFEPLSREESELYWRTRERGSQIGGWASWQSKVLWSAEPGQLEAHQRRKSVARVQEAAAGSDALVDIERTDIEDGRTLLEQRVKEMEERFAGVKDIPLPPFWGGVRLVPESVEFWQGRRSRLHDRFRYVPAEGEALASGAFAALNGLFAKLTTDQHTTSFAQSLAHLFGLDSSPFLELLVRGACLGLNVLCNIIMWALFTRALTAGPSTTKVSITNTAANFLATALFGMVVFREAVGGLWWLGAAMMGAGCILVGMRDGV